MHIAVVEDERSLASALKKGLEQEGNSVDLYYDAASARYQLMRSDAAADLIILDLMLPDDDGRSVCSDLRASGVTTPVLVLTARDSAEDTIELLDRGADDFMSKPFNFDELLARVRALTRRAGLLEEQEVRVGNLIITPERREVMCQGQMVPLTAREFDILLHLVIHRGRVVSRAQLLQRFWGSTEKVSSNVVDVHVRNIRKKLEDDHASHIQTIHGSGYLFAA